MPPSVSVPLAALFFLHLVQRFLALPAGLPRLLDTRCPFPHSSVKPRAGLAVLLLDLAVDGLDLAPGRRRAEKVPHPRPGTAEEADELVEGDMQARAEEVPAIGQSIDHGFFERAVAVNYRQGGKVDLGRGEAKQDRQRIVDAGVGVEHDAPRVGAGHSSSP